jgi:dephospho-CoA kinase
LGFDVLSALRLGLTGGIGSGKSTVASLLAAGGATVIDADAISRATTAAKGSAIAAIEIEFGPAFITAERALDREKMRDLVFSDPSAKTRLEQIVHPLVRQEIACQTQAAEAMQSKCIVFDIPLLVESGHWRQSLNRILVIDCTEETQVSRVMARNGMDRIAVQKIIATQSSRTRRLRCADAVLFNDSISLAELARMVAKICPLFGL